MWKQVRERIHKNKLADRWLTNRNFRTMVLSAFSFTGNIAYAVFNMSVAAFSHSLWCGALACYYTVLAFLRGNILIHSGKAHRGQRADTAQQTLTEVKRYRLCGIVFLPLTVCLFALVLLIVRAEKVFAYELYVTYTVAGYTLYQITAALVNYVRAQKNDNFAVRSLICINLTATLVSLLSLQSVALTTFSEHVNIPFVNALTGLFVCGSIVANGVRMIVKATVRIRQLQRAD